MTINVGNDGFYVIHERNAGEALVKWQEAKKSLDFFKEQEMLFRKSIVRAMFPAATVGTNNLPLNGGAVLKAVLKEDYNLMKDDVKKQALAGEPVDPWKSVTAVLDAFAVIGGDVGNLLADRLVKWEPTVSVSEYKQLTKPYRDVFDTVLTIKPASPELKLDLPKAK